MKNVEFIENQKDCRTVGEPFAIANRGKELHVISKFQLQTKFICAVSSSPSRFGIP